MTCQYRCLGPGCGFEWLGEPGPTECPKCQHLYVKWVNFDQIQLIKYMIEHDYVLGGDAVGIVDRAMPELKTEIARALNEQILAEIIQDMAIEAFSQ